MTTTDHNLEARKIERASASLGGSPGVEPATHDRFRYLPYLDGMRAVSILMVLGFHQMGPISQWISNVIAGWSGVWIFFVISGFLITSILVQEQEDQGRFSIKRFYIRRCLRIWPAYYAFLLVGLMLRMYGPTSTAYGAVYLTNYAVAFNWPRGGEIQHLWSLAVEEQFYLVWPFVLLLSGRRALAVATGLIAAVWTWRLALFLSKVPWLRLTPGFDTQVDSILMGCVAALAWARPDLRQRLRHILGGAGVPGFLAIGLFLAAQTLGHPSDSLFRSRLLLWTVRLPLFEALTALLILALIIHQGSAITRFLSTRPMVALGKLSYGIYLWHGLVLALWVIYVPRKGLLASNHFRELGILVSYITVAAASYALIEMPFLKLKKRWEVHQEPAKPMACEQVLPMQTDPRVPLSKSA